MVLKVENNNRSNSDMSDIENDYKKDLDIIFKNTLIKWDEKFGRYKEMAENSKTHEEYESYETLFREHYYAEKIEIFDETFKIIQKMSHSDKRPVKILLNMAELLVQNLKLKQLGDNI